MMIVRLDKYLAMLGLVSRRDAAKVVKTGAVLVDGKEAEKSDMKIHDGQVITYKLQTQDKGLKTKDFDSRAESREQRAEIISNDKPLNPHPHISGGSSFSKEPSIESNDQEPGTKNQYEIEVKEFVYILLHKPAGYVCSELDEGGHHSYKMLLQDCPYAPMLHVAGRLDRDTEGLVFCTNDGNFTHDIISPKKKEEKEYYVELLLPISDDGLSMFEKGITLDDGYITMPAKVKKVSEKIILLTIHEGKYHQVKRMAEAVNNEVVYLRRERIGNWTLEGLEKGKRRYLTNSPQEF